MHASISTSLNTLLNTVFVSNKNQVFFIKMGYGQGKDQQIYRCSIICFLNVATFVLHEIEWPIIPPSPPPDFFLEKYYSSIFVVYFYHSLEKKAPMEKESSHFMSGTSTFITLFSPIYIIGVGNILCKRMQDVNFPSPVDLF